jgi:hypothetical protein
MRGSTGLCHASSLSAAILAVVSVGYESGSWYGMIVCNGLDKAEFIIVLKVVR